MSQIVKIKMRRNLVSAASDTYEFNMKSFDNGQLEEIFQFFNNFKKVIYGTVTTTSHDRINYLHTILYDESLQEFGGLNSNNTGTNNFHLK